VSCANVKVLPPANETKTIGKTRKRDILRIANLGFMKTTLQRRGIFSNANLQTACACTRICKTWDVPENFQPRDAKQFAAALRRFDEENSRDPNLEDSQPRELLYAQRLSDWVLRLAPNTSEELRLAARCQHICRWQIPRNSYPMTRAGYLKWREDLKKFHAQKAGEILRVVGYDENVVRRVQELNLKKNFPNDPEGRVIEDALCLVFLEFQFAALAAKTSDDKMIIALQKSWQKMTDGARTEALKLNYASNEKALLERALKR
jgi:Domain of unknown function (DUF4202)